MSAVLCRDFRSFMIRLTKKSDFCLFNIIRHRMKTIEIESLHNVGLNTQHNTTQAQCLFFFSLQAMSISIVFYFDSSGRLIFHRSM